MPASGSMASSSRGSPAPVDSGSSIAPDGRSADSRSGCGGSSLGARLRSASTSTRRRRTVSVSASTCSASIRSSEPVVAGSASGGVTLGGAAACSRRKASSAADWARSDWMTTFLSSLICVSASARRARRAVASAFASPRSVSPPGRCPSRAVARSSMASRRSAIACVSASPASAGLSSAACPTDPIRLAELQSSSAASAIGQRRRISLVMLCLPASVAPPRAEPWAEPTRAENASRRS